MGSTSSGRGWPSEVPLLPLGRHDPNTCYLSTITFADGACRSLGFVWWLNPPVTREAVCSVPRTGAPVVVLGFPDCPDGAGEEEPEGDCDGDWEPPDGGGEEGGGRDGVNGVLGTDTGGGAGSGRLGTDTVGVVTGPIVRPGA